MLLLSAKLTAYAENIEEVEVFGTSQDRPTLADIDLSTYNGFEDILNRADFEHRLVDISDIINQSISTQIRKSGGLGSSSQVAIRGSSGKQVNVYLDGMLLTNPQSGNNSISVIPTSLIEQIEIYPDFTPGQLGDANIGGALNIRTRLPKPGFGGRVASSFGSFNTYQNDLGLWGGSESTQAIFALSHSQSDNNYTVKPEKCLEINQSICADDKKRQRAAFEQYSLLTKVSHQFNEQYTLQALIGSAKTKNQIPSFLNYKNPKADVDNDLHQFHLLFQSEGDNFSWGTRLYGNQQKEQFDSVIVNAPNTRNDMHVKQQLDTLGGNVFSELYLGGNTLSLALDYSQAQSRSDDEKHLYKVKAKREKLSLSLSDYWQIVDSFAINAVVRTIQYKDSTDIPTINAGFGAHCSGENKECTRYNKVHNSWQTGFAWTPGNWTFKANIGETLRMPTLSERFGVTGNFVGTPTLKHERSKSFEIGMLYSSDLWDFSLVTFNKDIHNGIYVFYYAQGIGKPENVSQVELSGHEAFVRLKLSRYFSLFVGKQWLDSKNRSEAVAYKGKKLAGIYHQSFQAGLAVTTDNHHWSLNHYRDKGMYYDHPNRIAAPERKIVDTSYTVTIQRFTLNFSINNIFNHYYYNYNFLAAPGRSFSTTLSYNF